MDGIQTGQSGAAPSAQQVQQQFVSKEYYVKVPK